MSFKNKVVLVTGGSAGIGAATAELFAKEGANLAIVGRDEVRIKKVAQNCEKFGSVVLAIKADISKDKEAITIIKQVVDKFGKLDVLINNAAIFKTTNLTSPDILKTYDEVTNINLRAVIHLTSLAAPYLKQTKGNIVNISSILGESYVQSPQYLMYCVSKAALNNYTRGAALELAASGVRVNIVSPGPVRTEMLANIPDRTLEDNLASTALNRISEPEDIANMITFLASDKAKSITGSIFTVDNGLLLKY